jgi:hypothetical protein
MHKRLDRGSWAIHDPDARGKVNARRCIVLAAAASVG